MQISFDVIIRIILVLFFIKGWMKGFFKSLLGPISLIIGVLLSIAYYKESNNLFYSFLFSFFSPIIIRIALGFAVKVFSSSDDNKKKKLPSLISSLLGACFCTIWNGFYIALILLIIGIAPIKNEKFQKVQNNILNSQTYNYLRKFTGNKIPTTTNDIKEVTSILQDPKKLEELRQSKEFKQLVDDEKLQTLLNDPETIRQIEEKDFGKLFSNPAIQEIMKDKELLKKFLEVNKKLFKQNLEIEPADPSN